MSIGTISTSSGNNTHPTHALFRYCEVYFRKRTNGEESLRIFNVTGTVSITLRRPALPLHDPSVPILRFFFFFK